MRKPIFVNSEIQQLFDKQGYVVIPFINDVQRYLLDDCFEEMHADLPKSGFFTSSYSPDKEYKQNVSNRIVEILTESYQNTFQNFQPFGASFLFKMPTGDSALAVHQDWTIVNEEIQYALNCWIPLTEITKDNGTLMVLPGSHFDNYRSLRAPTLGFFFSKHEDVVMDALIPVMPKLGEAVILNQSLIHYSPPNKSQLIRKAITAGVKSKNAPMFFHYQNPETKALEKYSMSEDFLLGFEDFMNDIFKKPKGFLKEQIEYEVEYMDAEKLKAKVKFFMTRAGILPNRPNNLIGKLKAMFGNG